MTQTFGNLLNDWITSNKVSKKICLDRFGLNFYNWLKDLNAPRDNMFTSISDMTGIPVDVIHDCVNNTRAKIKKEKSISRLVDNHTEKKKPEVKPVEHTQEELVKEATAVRNLKDALAGLNDNTDFDGLLLDYVEKLNKRTELLKKIDEIRDTVRNLDEELAKMRTNIRSVA